MHNKTIAITRISEVNIRFIGIILSIPEADNTGYPKQERVKLIYS